ncbi:phage tail tape measure protein [Motiliproteus sp.]|uniref:phage tail tape measure protein n=1 Tax=Motiliproteus sp. TaxID=1898955 RepID=UPI003BAB6ED6
MSRDLRLQLILDIVEKASAPLRKVDKSAGATADTLKQTRDQLKQLQRQQKDVSSFRELQRATKQNRSEFAQATEVSKRLKRQLEATENPTKKLTREHERAARRVEQLKSKQIGYLKTLKDSRAKLEQAGVSTRKLADYQKQLDRRTQQASESLEKQKRHLTELANKQKRLAQLKGNLDRARNGGMIAGAHGAAGVFAGQRMLSGMAGAVMPGIEFDASMSRVQALTRMGKDDPAMQALRDQARDLGANTSFTATDAAGGQGFLAMAGFTPQAIKAAMPGMLDLAKAAGQDIATTADLGSNILSGFNLQADQMGRVGDILTGTFTRSNTNLQMLGDTMSYVAPVASGLGSDLEEVAAMAGKLGDEGIQGSQAGTALRAIYSRLAAPTKQSAQMLAELSIATKDANGNLRPMADMLEELHQATEAMGDTQRAEIFKQLAGEEAFSGLSVLVKQAGSGELQTLIKSLREANGEAAKTADVMGDNARGDLNALASVWQDLGIQIETTNDGPIRELIQNTTEMVRGWRTWAAENQETVAMLIKWGAILGVTVTVLGALGIALGGTVIFMGGFIKSLMFVGPLLMKLIPVVKGLSLMLMANPIALAVAGVAALAVAIYSYWDEIKALFGGAVDWMSEVGGDIINALIDGVLNHFKRLKDSFLKVANYVRGLFGGLFGGDSSTPAKQVAIDTRQPLQSPQAAAAGGPSVGQIVINAAPGMDEQTLARLVGQELDRRTRGAQARRRSSLRDND